MCLKIRPTNHVSITYDFLFAVRIFKMQSYKSRQHIIEDTISVSHTVYAFSGSIAVEHFQFIRLQRAPIS